MSYQRRLNALFETKRERRERLETEERGGTRGGRDRFDWDSVKNDKYRLNYLGNSVHASVGRWQQSKDIFWWTKDGQRKQEDPNLRHEEVNSVKMKEQQYMNAALGIGGPVQVERGPVSKDDIQRAMENSEIPLAPDAEDPDAEALTGLGFAKEGVLSRVSGGTVSKLEGMGVDESISNRATGQPTAAYSGHVVPSTTDPIIPSHRMKSKKESKKKRHSKKKSKKHKHRKRSPSVSSSSSENAPSRRGRSTSKRRSRSSSYSRSRSSSNRFDRYWSKRREDSRSRSPRRRSRSPHSRDGNDRYRASRQKYNRPSMSPRHRSSDRHDRRGSHRSRSPPRRR